MGILCVLGASKQKSKIFFNLGEIYAKSSKDLVNKHLHMCVYHLINMHTHTEQSIKIDSMQFSEGGVSSTQQSRIKVLLQNNSSVKTLMEM